MHSELHSVEVSIAFTCSRQEDDYDPLAIIDAIPHISELSLDQPRYVPSILQWLGRPGSDGSWPCPGLKELSVVTWPEQFLDDILEMVRSRYGGRDAAVSIEMLSILDGLSSQDACLWDEIVAIVGASHTKLIWNP